MGAGVGMGWHALLAELRAYPFGINDQQHQVEGMTVERVAHLVHLPRRRGVDEPLLRQGSGRASTSCTARRARACSQSAPSAMW